MHKENTLEASHPKRTGVTGPHLLIGGISQALLIAYGALTIIGGSSLYQMTSMGGMTLPNPIYPEWDSVFRYFQTAGLIGIVASIVFLVFVILLTVPVIETGRAFRGRKVGNLAIVSGLVTLPMGIMYYLGLINREMYYLISYDGGYVFVPVTYLGWQAFVYNAFFGIVFLVLVGTTMALFGASFVVNSRHFSMSGLWKTTGTLYLIAASLYLTVLLDLFGAIVSVAAGTIGLICFMKSKVKGRLNKGEN